MGKDREKRRSSRERSRERNRDSRDRRRRDRDRRRSRDRDRKRHRSRSRDKDRRSRDRSRDRRRNKSSSPPPPSSASTTAAPTMRTNFTNILSSMPGLMGHELALNPHLLSGISGNGAGFLMNERQPQHLDQQHQNPQLMRLNSDFSGLGSSTGGIFSISGSHSERSNQAMSNNSDSCENSQDGGDALSRAEERKRKRKSRWAGGDHDKTFIPGMPTILPPTLSADQQEAYLVQLQIEEISRKLRTGDLGISMNLEERSPSPEPIYSSDGKRLNTREFRTRKKLEEQRHQLVLRMQCMNPDFKPPADYKPPVIRVSDKVLIPQEQHPDINFVGLLIGPRGNTLKAMEKETGAKIIIRGKGSVKEGKVGRKDGQPLPGEDEPLHAFITAGNPECVKKAVDKIKEVIKQGIEVPEGHNDLRRMQLRELAQLNGTLRETDGPRCNNCGSSDHKSWLCPDKPNVTNNILCSICGGAGHIAKDCRAKKTGTVTNNSQAKIDEEYMSLMAELGEAPPGEQNQAPKPPPQQQRYGLFEPRQAPRPIMAAQPPPQPQPPPPIQPPWNQAPAPPPAAPPSMLGPPPPPIPMMPPGTQAPPMMPWMTAPNGHQPPPPGSVGMEMYQPPPPPPGMPPPPPGTMDQWGPPPAPPGTAPPFPWSQTTGFISPPGVPPLPPPGTQMPNLLAPPPPPPPS